MLILDRARLLLGQGYLSWLSDKTNHRYRLLSEAEWEYACRAGTTTAYQVGSEITNYHANTGGEIGKTIEVGSFSPNDWGLHDMHGNVWGMGRGLLEREL
jgi:formylglycine-generating enzyme required for sulfatase activity